VTDSGKGVGKKFSGVDGGQRKKDPKIAKKTRKIAQLSLFQGGRGNGKKTEK